LHNCSGAVATNNGRYHYKATCSIRYDSCESIDCLRECNDDEYNAAIERDEKTIYDALADILEA
ncbi:MAG: hypothetical protein Q7K43_00810, partial [Candidatus Woesearchaeota archaeon]|nr:hypothetical protein [Candidatus Woesearchaeota archaeon]